MYFGTKNLTFHPRSLQRTVCGVCTTIHYNINSVYWLHIIIAIISIRILNTLYFLIRTAVVAIFS